MVARFAPALLGSAEVPNGVLVATAAGTRQGLGPGNGLLFNTMDLFNPFSPTDIDREYKVGNDMVFTQFYINNKDVQVLFYTDVVIGGGIVGYLGNAVWRTDSTLTVLRDNEATKDLYVTLTANIDYSWGWWQKNLYGFIEFYYNSLSDGDYAEALINMYVTVITNVIDPSGIFQARRVG